MLMSYFSYKSIRRAFELKEHLDEAGDNVSQKSFIGKKQVFVEKG